MKEQFRDKVFGKHINIQIGPDRVWEGLTQNVMDWSIRLVNEYQDMGYKLTLRQLYYQLVSRDIIPNHLKVYSKLSKLISDARYNGDIDWNAIEDRGRVPNIPSEWENVVGIVETASRAYRLPRWSDQDNYVEVLTEKDALSSIMEPITNKWHIPLVVNKGYASSTAIYNMSKRIISKLGEQYVHILYLGDHDPSGLDMNRDIMDRLREFIWKDFDDITFHHIALTYDQIDEYDPPPNPAKITDPRAKKYLAEFGESSWEVDALRPEVMTEIVENSIEALVDQNKYDKWVELEDVHKDKLKDAAMRIAEEEEYEEE